MELKYKQISEKITNIFTNLRNVINEREKFLIENLNKIISKRKQIEILNKVMNDITKAKDELNDTNLKLDENFLKKCDKNINNINDDIKIYKREIENFEDFFTYEENTYDEILEKIKNLGKFTINKNSEYITFKWKSGNNYSLSNDHRLATKISGGDNYNCNILGDIILSKNKISRWKIKLNKFDFSFPWNILVGVAPSNINQNNSDLYNKTWTLICGYPAVSIKEGNPTYSLRKKEKLKEGDIIEVIMNLTNGELSFSVNGILYGVACTIPLDIDLSPFILLRAKGQSIELLN